MKFPSRTLFAAATLLAVSSVSAATLNWDPGLTPATPSGGAGTWNTNTTANWTSDLVNDVNWTDTTGADTAVFGGTGGAVTLAAGGVTANALTFNVAGYTLGGGSLTLAGATPTITTNADAAISSIITGATGLTKSGSGILTLSGANTYAGGTTVSAGTLRFSAVNNLQGATSVASGATVEFLSPQNGATIANAFTGTGTLRLNLNNATAGNTTVNNIT